MSKYKEKIIELFNEGKSLDDIVKTVGCSKQLVRYYALPAVRKSHIKSSTKRKRDINILLKKIHGGKCRKCGYDKCLNALDFHHIDADKKDSAVHDYIRRSMIKDARIEANKCLLVCSNCHREHHAGLTSFEGMEPIIDDIGTIHKPSDLFDKYDIK